MTTSASETAAGFLVVDLGVALASEAPEKTSHTAPEASEQTEFFANTSIGRKPIKKDTAKLKQKLAAARVGAWRSALLENASPQARTRNAKLAATQADPTTQHSASRAPPCPKSESIHSPAAPAKTSASSSALRLKRARANRLHASNSKHTRSPENGKSDTGGKSGESVVKARQGGNSEKVTSQQRPEESHPDNRRSISHRRIFQLLHALPVSPLCLGCSL